MKAANLARLAALKRAHGAQRDEAAARRAQEAEAAAREHAERHLFARAVGPVTPQARGQRAELPRAPAHPSRASASATKPRRLAATLSDEFDVSTLLDTDDGLSFRREASAPMCRQAAPRRVDDPGPDRPARPAPRRRARPLAAFVREAERDGLRCVRVVHGKGHGSPGREPVLKDKVKRWLVQKNEVIAFTQARAADGGHGALLVLLASR